MKRSGRSPAPLDGVRGGRVGWNTGSRFFGVLLLSAITAACDASEPEVAAPHLLGAEKMVGALHVSWENREPAADAIELERRTTAPDGKLVADFAVLYTLPGAADNKHDVTATEDMTYAYRARCKKAGRYSPYSNEISADPVR